VFLTNDFDDPLEGWDTRAYVPCLRTDDLVFKLHERRTVERLGAARVVVVVAAPIEALGQHDEGRAVVRGGAHETLGRGEVALLLGAGIELNGRRPHLTSPEVAVRVD
jgi:hypothetical protein